MKKGWLDKYENGGEYLGTTNVGRNYSPAWGGAWENGGTLQPPMAGANQTLPMYQMGGYVYPTTFVPQAEMGGSIPGSVGFTYARTGSTPSEGPYAKKTLPSAQNGQEMSFYQHGLDWTPRNISKNGSEIPMAQPGITEPLRGDIQTRGNQNLLTEIAAQKTKEKKAQEARTRTTIGADTRTAKQKEKDRQAYESKLKYEKEVLGKDFETPQYLQEKNRARAEHLIHLADVGSMGAGLITGAGELAAKQLPKVGEYLTTQTPLKNAYKYNPWAFKANPEAGYRMIGGKEGYLDAITSGQIRPTGAYEHAHFNIGQPLNPNRLSAEELIQAGSPGGYKGPYMAEMQQGTWQRMSDAFPNNPEMQEQFRLLGKDKDVWQHPLFGNIKVDDTRLKLYKEDWLRGYKEVPKKEKGGIVKDNMGYWNPDNWGKVVEIDSPNITMKGVNQDLIGISDEGDVQYMEPGKDYKFKGKKVKEYPVAKNGVNQQDEKTAQHLDQLLNFTNYNKPTKGGWLDKY